MAAVLACVAQIADPAEAAREIARLNDRLAHERRIPREVVAAVHEVAAGVTQTALARWEAIDPYLTLILHRSVIAAQEALDDRDRAAGRDRLRIALEGLRQAFAAIAESEPVGDDRSAKEIARWLAETAEVSQAQLAELLGVSLRQFQRWISPHVATQPEGEDARRVRAVARIVNQLRFSLTPTGAIGWFDWPRDDLGGATPAELLDDAARLPELTAAAGSMRGTYAA